jgi:exodeoxyribonuclease V alpha subunit
MEKISGNIEHIIYAHPDNGFTVAKMRQTDKDDITSIIGYLPSVQPGEALICEGTWKLHPKHGWQFEVQSYETTYPADIVGIQKYLESGLIKGIGPSYAKKIIDKFGLNTLQIIDDEPKRLLEIPGIGDKKITQIIECWNDQRSIRKVMIFLRTYGVSPGYAQKIYKRFKDDSIKKVSENPYELAKEVTGIGFKIADKIAKELGFSNTCPERLKAGIEFSLWELINAGHTCYPECDLINYSAEILEAEKNLIKAELDILLINNILVKKDDYIWLKNFYIQEEQIAKELIRIKNDKSTIQITEIDAAINWVQKKLNIQLEQKQITALINSIKEKLHIITGGPGTGKSTITKALLSIMEKKTTKILLAAPTGRAAKRLSQITGKKAFTIHSSLEFDPVNFSFKKNRENQLNYDLVIVDEASMIDTNVMFHFLLAIPSSVKLIFIGDIDQLPSVGAGNILKDLIASDKIKTTRLTEIFRQAANSKIIVNAHRVNLGEFPYLTTANWCDFHFYEANDPEEIKTQVLKLVCEIIPESKKLDPFKDIQVLSPMKKGIIGIESFNYALQNKLNPSELPFHRMGKTFHLNDKVMQTKNNYQKKVYNGDVGYIIQIDQIEQLLYVDFNNKIVEYDFSELDEVVLAYAVSVHKYQGSECPCIVIPIHTSHFKLLHRNLLYTAITRGKKFVVLVGSKKAIAIAVKNNEVQLRFTGLKNFIKTTFIEPSCLL